MGNLMTQHLRVSQNKSEIPQATESGGLVHVMAGRNGNRLGMAVELQVLQWSSANLRSESGYGEDDLEFRFRKPCKNINSIQFGKAFWYRFLWATNCNDHWVLVCEWQQLSPLNDMRKNENQDDGLSLSWHARGVPQTLANLEVVTAPDQVSATQAVTLWGLRWWFR